MTADLDPAAVSGTSSEAAEKATGKPWAAWMALLDEAGGRGMTHKELVAHLGQHHRVSDWWLQQIAVTYEKSRGLRQTHEMPDGYQISRTRTMAAPAEAIYEAWTDEAKRRRWLPDAEMTVRKATPHKIIRLQWGDGTLVEARLAEKGLVKTAVTIQHNKLPDADTAEQMKAYWAAALERLQALVAAKS
jgi:uncharacterized protein YndB with AHSA1/START domain